MIGISFLQWIGGTVIRFCSWVGLVPLFALRAFCAGMTPPYYGRIWSQQFIAIGFFSLPIVGLMALFTGMALAIQTYTGFARFHGESAVATVIILSMTRELGPALSGVVLAGRISASIAAELGTMRVTQQIDALVTLSVNPLRYLVFPRLIAGLIALPLLVLVVDIIGVFGGYLISTYKLGFNSAVYLKQTVDLLKLYDVLIGLIKAGCFGLIVSLMGCYHGYTAQGGSQGVGIATTRAVVSASIGILLSNYVLTMLLCRI